MRLSENTRSNLYKAISEPIMQARITIQQSADVLGDKNAKDIDELMFRLELKTWREVKKVLKIKD